MKYFKFLFSGTFMGLLLILFAIVIGYATFIENDHGAISARSIIYNAVWFEVLLLLMVVNFIGMIFTKRLYIKDRLNILIIHVALVIIIAGAGITRYIGFEGQMHIRSGETSNLFQSTDTYLQLQLKQGEHVLNINEKILLSPLQKKHFSKTYQWQEDPVEVVLGQYYPSAKPVLEKVENGDPYITVVAGSSDRHEFTLKEGESESIHGQSFSFGDTSNTDFIQIKLKDDDLYVRLPQPKHIDPNIDTLQYVFNGFVPLSLMSIHTFGHISFAVKEFVKNGRVNYIDDSHHMSVAEGTEVIQAKINEQDIFLPIGKQQTMVINDAEMTLKVGYKLLELPFALRLNAFELERYPGSNSPSSFASDVTVIDENKNIEKPYRIFMNNILSYGGYRFYQSSYDNDEQGTILSVNHDYWGTVITYIGYFLLFGSLIASFFTKKTRFRRISDQINEIHQKRKSLLTTILIFCLFLGGTFNGMAQDVNVIDREHAYKYGRLLVQNRDGRIEPINTAAGKTLLKFYKKTSYEGLTPEQVSLDMIMAREKWKSKPIIKVDNPKIQKLIGIQGEYATFSDFFDKKGLYILRTPIEQANVKKPALRNTYDKALINVDERVNVFFMTLNSSFLNIFPLMNDPNNKWVTPTEFHKLMGHGSEYGDLFENYLIGLLEAKKTNNYSKADEALRLISKYQSQIGKAIMPSATKINLEIFYNNAELFKKLFPVYLIIGFLLVALFFWQTFNPAFEFKIYNQILSGTIGIIFLVHTLGLGLRWYISGHEPWSNGYESMIYISWATILAGFIIKKEAYIIIGLSAILSGITLLTAHMSWMNPEITNLVPVLKSYWLTFHVATITASYGFLALGCMLGFLNLWVMIFRNKQNIERINLTLKELTLIVEIALIVGLVFLVIGNFLGGIWANESWGRYWGWDPKETWTLVTIIIYSFTLHTTLIPGFKNLYTFNFLAMVGFSTVLMTYFGVNYFLSGLHSYAGGDPVVIPGFVYYVVATMLIVSILAAFNTYKVDNNSTNSSTTVSKKHLETNYADSLKS